ncbi:hypothetical protein EDB19DRAFT_1829738 [Suillus lakei]|nr:hypothetical protein EDB19DRAFT_1829738 [Suillus lakei]
MAIFTPKSESSLKDEPELIYRCMIVFDGNNLLSRMAPLGGREVGNTRKFHSDYYLEPHYIDIYWDEDKYLNLGNMLNRNYIQARQIIDEQQIAIWEAKISQPRFHLTWSLEQSHYLATAGHEAEWDIHAIAYVELLQKLREARAAAENASTLFLNATPVNYEFVTPSTTSTSHYATNLSQTRKLEMRRQHTNKRYDSILQDVVTLELKNGNHSTMGTGRSSVPCHPEVYVAV